MSSCVKCGHRPIKKTKAGERNCRHCGPQPEQSPKQ